MNSLANLVQHYFCDSVLMRGAPCKDAIISWSKIWIFPPRRYQEKSGLLRTRLTYMCIHTPRCTFCTSPGYALNFDWWHSRWEFHIIRAAGPYLAEEIPARRRARAKHENLEGGRKVRLIKITPLHLQDHKKGERERMSLIGTLQLCIVWMAYWNAEKHVL